MISNELIAKINEKCPSDQGIFKEPYGIPVNIKEPVIYTRVRTGGYEGGDYLGTKPVYCKEDYTLGWDVLDILLEEIAPEITLLQFRKIQKLIKTNEKTQSDDFYGNSDEYLIGYIILRELVELLKSLGYEINR